MQNDKKAMRLENAYICLGALLLSISLSVFLVPSRLSSGGVSTLGSVLLHLFSVPLSITTLLANSLLFAVGYKSLGRAAALKSAIGVFWTSVFLELTAYLPPYTDVPMLAAIAGGVLMGIGIGLVVRQEASTGGSDFVALLLHRRYPHISVSVLILGIDVAIIVLAGLVFKSLTTTIYSIIALFLSTKSADFVITFGEAAKTVYVFSTKATAISEQIHFRFQRGTTGIYSRGMYSGENRLLLLAVVRPKELPSLLHLIRSIDSAAFIVVSDAREVVGEGFGSGDSYDRLPKGRQKTYPADTP